MKKFSAQYIITNKGPVLKRGIITAEDNGTIVRVEDTGGNLTETGSITFHNGIIVPGFVNCHCHLELSHLKAAIPTGTGLSEFIRLIRNQRETVLSVIEDAILKADNEMYSEGTVFCADICNTSNTFKIKSGSRTKYLNLLEVFGIDPHKASKRLSESEDLAKIAESFGLHWSIVPHSVYSVSLPLLALIKKRSTTNKVTSIHFMESRAEEELLKNHSGTIIQYYRDSGLLTQEPLSAHNHSSAILDEVTGAGNLILVHCTYTDTDTVKEVSSRENLYWCLCPNSNCYIENHLPPVDLLRNEGCKIVVGTDSLASNTHLSILKEMKTLQDNFPLVPLEEMVMWATINGSMALGEEQLLGSLEPGKKPGLLLLENVDLQNMKLLPETRVERLI